MTDPQAIRAQFPMLGTTSRGKPIVYLDSGASAQKPQAVLDAMMAYYTGSYANIHRGVYEASERASLAYDGTRNTVAKFLGGVSPEEIVFVRGTTEAINLVAQSFLRPTLKRHGRKIGRTGLTGERFGTPHAGRGLGQRGG